jgi:hypothetical protein
MDLKHPLWRPAAATLPRDTDVVLEFGQRAVGDSITTSPITAQRLEPEVMPVFIRDFPFFDLIEKVPSNGIQHTFLQQTNHTQSSSPHTISETGTVADDANVYLRKTTNIAVFGERRGVTLKSKYAGLQAGGPSTDLMAREVQGGLITIARDAQMEMLRFTETDSGSSGATDPNGQYDAEGINGLRFVLNNLAPPENSVACDVVSPWTDQRVLNAFRTVAQNLMDKGGRPDIIVCSAFGSNSLFKDQQEFVRYMDNRLEITPGRTVRVVSTDAGDLPVLIVPGFPGLGSYTVSGSTFQDMYVLQLETLEIPYLGAPEPTVLRIPIGVDGTLRELAIPFALYGLACKAPQYLGRVVLQTA